MKDSNYKSYNELPLFLNAETVEKVLGVSLSHSCELMYGSDFSVLKIDNQMVIPKESFIK